MSTFAVPTSSEPSEYEEFYDTMSPDTPMAEPSDEGQPPSMSDLLAVIENMRAENAAVHASLRAENAALRAQVQSLPLANTSAIPPATSTTPTAPLISDASGSTGTHGERRPRAPKLSSFDGQRTNYKPWRIEVTNKLVVDGPIMGGEYGKISAIYAALDPAPKKNMASTVQRMLASPTPNVMLFLEHLDVSYGNPHEVQQALQKLNSLRQGTRSFITFLPEFERLLSEAGGDNWPEEVKIDRLCNAVSVEILGDTTNVPLPKDYLGTVNMLRSIAENRYYLEQRRKAEQPRGSNASKKTPEAAKGRGAPAASQGQAGVSAELSSVMEWEPVNAVRVATMNAKGHPQGPGLSTDAALRGRRAKWVSKEEMERRRTTGVCLRCARNGCRIALCPLAGAKNPNLPVKVQQVTFEKEEVSEPMEEGEIDEEKQGKE